MKQWHLRARWCGKALLAYAKRQLLSGKVLLGYAKRLLPSGRPLSPYAKPSRP